MATLTDIYKFPVPSYSDGAALPDNLGDFAARVEATLPRLRKYDKAQGATNPGDPSSGLPMIVGAPTVELFKSTISVTTIGVATFDIDVICVTDANVSSSPAVTGQLHLEVAGVVVDSFRYHTLGKTAHFPVHLHADVDLPRTVTSLQFRVLGNADAGGNTAARAVYFSWRAAQVGALRT